VHFKNALSWVERAFVGATALSPAPLPLTARKEELHDYETHVKAGRNSRYLRKGIRKGRRHGWTCAVGVKRPSPVLQKSANLDKTSVVAIAHLPTCTPDLKPLLQSVTNDTTPARPCQFRQFPPPETSPAQPSLPLEHYLKNPLSTSCRGRFFSCLPCGIALAPVWRTRFRFVTFPFAGTCRPGSFSEPVS
jgi:hypothetical protein